MTQAVFDPSAARAKAGPGRVAFVHALWHPDIVLQAYEGFAEEMTSFGFDADRIDRFEAPGAFEIPLLAQRLARTGRYAGVVAAAFVVDGGIYRHEFVADAVIAGLMGAQLGVADVPTVPRARGAPALLPRAFSREGGGGRVRVSSHDREHAGPRGAR